MKLRPVDSSFAVYFGKDSGPWFSRALGCYQNDIMNESTNCYCVTNQAYREFYNVPNDYFGNSVLTGQGKD